MGWLHQCKKPCNFRIWPHRARAYALWKCPECDTTWSLIRRNPTGHYAFWEWRRTTI